MKGNRSTLDRARDALSELYGMIPPRLVDKRADECVRVIEHALFGYGEALSSLREIENKLFHSGKAQERVANQITAIRKEEK